MTCAQARAREAGLAVRTCIFLALHILQDAASSGYAALVAAGDSAPRRFLAELPRYYAAADARSSLARWRPLQRAVDAAAGFFVVVDAGALCSGPPIARTSTSASKLTN